MGIQHRVQKIPESTIAASTIGIVTAIIAILVYFGMNAIFSHLQPYQLIRAMQGTTNTFCFAGITASSTILPLMLTIFSYAMNKTEQFETRFYQRIKHIGGLCVGAFMAGLFTLMILSAPLGNMPEIDPTWHRLVYYLVILGIATMSGFLVTILVLLYTTISTIIHKLAPELEDNSKF